MTPDRATAAAVACEELAAALKRGAPVSPGTVALVASQLEWVATTHPLRGWPDEVLRVARAVRSGKATAAELRAFAGELRDGVAAMFARGWYQTMFGGRQ